MKYSLETAIKDLLANPMIKKKLEELVPGITTNPLVALAKNKSIKEITDKIPSIDEKTLKSISDFLKTVKD